MTKNNVKFEGALDSGTRKIINDNMDDVSYSTAQLSVASSTTLADVTGLTTQVGELVAGARYRFYIHLIGTANAAGGIKVALKQNNGLTLTSINSSAQGFTASAVAVQTVTSTTDAASLLASTSAVIKTVIQGTFVVATAGTLQVQAAQNASNASATTVEIGSHMTVTRIA